MAGAYENPRYTGIVDPNAFMNSFNQSFAMFSQIVRQKNIDKSVKDKELQKQKDEREQMYGTWERGIKEKLGANTYYSDQMTAKTREFANRLGDYARANNLSQRELDDLTMQWQNRATAYNTLSDVVWGGKGTGINVNNIDRSVEGADEFIQILNDVKNGKIDLGLAFDPETRSVTGGLTLSDGAELSWKEVQGYIQTFQAVDENGVLMNQTGKVNQDIANMEKSVKENYTALYERDSRGVASLGTPKEIAQKNINLRNKFKEFWRDEFDEDMKEGDVSILNKIWHNKMGDKNLFTIDEAKEIGFGGTEKDLEFLNSLDWGDIQKVIQFADKTDMSQEQLTELSGLGLDFDQKPGFTQEDLIFADKIINAQKDKVVDFMYNNNVGSIAQLSIPITEKPNYDLTAAEDKDWGLYHQAVDILNDSKINPEYFLGGHMESEVVGDGGNYQKNLSYLAGMLRSHTNKPIYTKFDSWNKHVKSVNYNNRQNDLTETTFTSDFIQADDNWPKENGKKKAYNDLTEEELIKRHPDYIKPPTEAAFYKIKDEFKNSNFFYYRQTDKGLALEGVRHDLSTVQGLFEYLREQKGITNLLSNRLSNKFGFQVHGLPLDVNIEDEFNRYLPPQ